MIKTMLCSGPTLKRRIADSRDRLYRVALAWCGDEMLADDLAQETIMTGIAKHRQLRNEDQLFAWLYRILNNYWYHYLRSKKVHSDLDDQIPSEDNDPCTDCQKLDVVCQVRNAVATLPMEQRQVISLVDLEDFSYCDVAEALGIPIGTVMSRLHRARKNLSVKLEKSLLAEPVASQQLHIIN